MLRGRGFGWCGRSEAPERVSRTKVGDLWMWLQLMLLQFEVVRGPAGVVCGRFVAGLEPFGPQAGPKSTPNNRDRTSDKLKLQPHEM